MHRLDRQRNITLRPLGFGCVLIDAAIGRILDIVADIYTRVVKIDVAPFKAEYLSATCAGDKQHKILNFPIPVIAAVDGYALGGGLVLAMMADYVIAGERAKFGFTEINFGMFANWGTTYTLGKGFSTPHMKHLMFSGETFGADETLSMNIVQKVVAPDELLSCAQAQAKLYASKAPIGVRAIKALLNNANGLNQSAHATMENYLTRLTFDSEDVKEGTQAFAEKRTPVFRNK